MSQPPGTGAGDPFGGRQPISHERMTGLPWDGSYAAGPAPQMRFSGDDGAPAWLATVRLAG